MALRGDVDQIPLSHILQGLLLNGQEGLLKLQGKSFERKVHVLSLGLRPLNSSRDKPDMLKAAVLQQKILTESQFQNILSAWSPGATAPGDFLVRRGALTAKAVEDEICHQLENILLELFATPGLRYEFCPEEDVASLEIFSPTGLGELLIYDVNGLLMEAMRRDDEWSRFRELIPSEHEIFVLADRTTVKPQELEIAPAAWKELRPLLKGDHTIRQMVQKTTLSSFEAHQVIFNLFNAGLVHMLPLERKKLLADKLRRSLRTAEAADVLQSVLAEDPDDENARSKLVTLLEKSKAPARDLISQYWTLAESKREENPGRSKIHAQKILSLEPTNMKALGLLFDLHVQANEHKDALSVARTVATAGRQQAVRKEAIELLYRIINFYPEEAFLFHEMADLHLEEGDTDSAVECLKTALAIHVKRHDYVKENKTRERIAGLHPRGAHKAPKRLARIQKRLTRSWQSLVRFAVLTTILGCVFTALLIFGGNEYFSRTALAQLKTDISTLNTYGAPQQAKHVLEDYARAFPYSLSAQSMDEMLADVEEKIRAFEARAQQTREQRRLAAQSEFARARIAATANNYEKAAAILKKIDTRGLDAKRAAEARELRRSIQEYFSGAIRLAELASEAEKKHDLVRSHALVKKLLLEYGKSPQARAARLSVQINTQPPGAELLVRDKVLGRTPLVLKLPADNAVKIALRKRGFEPTVVHLGHGPGTQLDPLESHNLLWPLTKCVEWQLDAKGSIEGFPCVLEEIVCVATRDGAIYALRKDDGWLKWKFSVPGDMDVSGGLVRWRNVVCFGSYDGKVYILDASSGKLAMPAVPATPKLLPIKKALSEPSLDGHVVANAASRALVSINLVTAQIDWAFPADDHELLGRPQARDESVYVATSAGDVVELDRETGKRRRKWKLGEPLAFAGKLAGDTYYAATASGRALALDVKTGNIRWSYETGDAITAPPAAGKTCVVFPLAKGILLALSKNGDPKWKLDIGEAVQGQSTGTFAGGRLYVGTAKGHILSIGTADGNLQWKLPTGKAGEKKPHGFLAPGAADDGRLFIGSENHTLYCVATE